MNEHGRKNKAAERNCKADNGSRNPDIVDAFLENPVIQPSVRKTDDMYELKDFAAMFKKILDECGSYPITIPRIPLLMPSEKIIRIESSDVEKILSYLNSALPPVA